MWKWIKSWFVSEAAPKAKDMASEGLSELKDFSKTSHRIDGGHILIVGAIIVAVCLYLWMS